MGKKIPYKPRPPSAKTLAHLNSVRNRLPDGVACSNAVFNQYKWVAKKRKYSWELTKEQFLEINKKLCFYCGSPPSNKRASQDNTGSYVYTGIDRVNNDTGYTVENTVPCCKICNIAKNDLSLNDFKVWITSVYERINK